jgi:hypothetical protein
MFRINRLKSILSWLNDELPKNQSLQPSHTKAWRHNFFDFSFYNWDSTRLFVKENMYNHHYSKIFKELENLEYNYDMFLRREAIAYIVIGISALAGLSYANITA